MTPELEQYLKRQPIFDNGMDKVLYRIYTEDKNRAATVAMVKRYFEGATLTYGLGLDSRTIGPNEPSVVIEIVTSKMDGFERVKELARDIRLMNEQVSVLITKQYVTTFEITD